MQKDYQKEDLTVHWKQDVCAHAGECVRNLNKVFDPEIQPWINVENATKEEIKATIDKCPSGALSYSESASVEANISDREVSVFIMKNGPVRIKGKFNLTDREGNETIEDGKFAFCRCGQSAKKPFCDGTHKNLGQKFDG